jgi:hypothetical protein
MKNIDERYMTICDDGLCLYRFDFNFHDYVDTKKYSVDQEKSGNVYLNTFNDEVPKNKKKLKTCLDFKEYLNNLKSLNEKKKRGIIELIDGEKKIDSNHWGEFYECLKTGVNKFSKILFNSHLCDKGYAKLSGFCTVDGTFSTLGITINDINALKKDTENRSPIMMMILHRNHFFPAPKQYLPKKLIDFIEISIEMAAKNLSEYDCLSEIKESKSM